MIEAWKEWHKGFILIPSRINLNLHRTVENEPMVQLVLRDHSALQIKQVLLMSQIQPTLHQALLDYD